MEITCKDNLNVTLIKSIFIDDKAVKTLSATISDNGKTISFTTDYVNNMKLYKANRSEIRKIEAEFEDQAFTEQEKILAENVTESDEQGDAS